MAYNDLQDYLRQLEGNGKLHWIKQEADPTWEVAAITRNVFERYGWRDRPALGLEHVGASTFPLVVGVIGGSPTIYAHALSTAVENIPAVWERAQRNLIEPVLVQSGLCKEIIQRAGKSISEFSRRSFGRQAKTLAHI